MYKELEQLMKEHNETPAELSRAIGISQSTISNWKARDNGMSIAKARLIADHYEMTMDELFERLNGEEK